ncbi:MAG: hypothetical protein HW421_2713 [Ignavibacteria bacterium]|nr:hypothetical protein [Ignavibacteria bacterium]
MKKSITLFSALVFSLMLIFTACKKNVTSPVEDSIKSSEDNAIVDGEFSSVFSFVDAQSETTLGSETLKKGDSPLTPTSKSIILPSGAVVSWDSASKTLIIDFGSTNILCNDGLLRRGKIIAVFSGKFKQVNFGVNVSLDNYYVQDMKVTGTKTMTYLGNYTINIVVQNASVTTPTGVISWSANRTVKKTAGYDSPLIILDDQYLISGNASGKNREGVNFSVVIDQNNPLKKKLSCVKKDFVSGIITIQNDKGNSLTVNYDPLGTEECNKLARVTVNGKSKDIILR